MVALGYSTCFIRSMTLRWWIESRLGRLYLLYYMFYMVPTLTDMCYKYEFFSNQSGHTTQIKTCPRAKQQGRVKCRRHVIVPPVPTQEAIPEEGG